MEKRSKKVNLQIDRLIDDDSPCSSYGCPLMDYGGCPTTAYYDMGTCYSEHELQAPPQAFESTQTQPCYYPNPGGCCSPPPPPPCSSPPPCCPTSPASSCLCPMCAQIATKMIGSISAYPLRATHPLSCPPCPVMTRNQCGCTPRGCVPCSLPSRNQDSALFKCFCPYKKPERCNLDVVNRMLDEKIDKILQPVLVTMARALQRQEQPPPKPKKYPPNFSDNCIANYLARMNLLQAKSSSSSNTSLEEPRGRKMKRKERKVKVDFNEEKLNKSKSGKCIKKKSSHKDSDEEVCRLEEVGGGYIQSDSDLDENDSGFKLRVKHGRRKPKDSLLTMEEKRQKE